MKENNISYDLLIRIKDNLQFIMENENKINQEEFNCLLNKLSPSLKDNLLLNANSHILKKIPFFSKNFSEEMLEELCFKLKESQYSPDDFIFYVYYFYKKIKIFSKMILIMILCTIKIFSKII